MRLLHAGLRADGDAASRRQSRSERRRHSALPLGQSVPLRRLSRDPGGGEARRAQAAAGVIAAPDPAHWPDRIFAVLKRGDIAQVGYVPDAGHARLIELCRADASIRDIVLTTEEEGVALAAG